MANSRVVVEAVESIDLHQVGTASLAGRSPRAADRDEQEPSVSPVGISHHNPPTHVAQGCLRIALQPPGDGSVEGGQTDGHQEQAQTVQDQEASNDSADGLNPARLCNKDEALSIVIQKLTEIVNGNKQQQGETVISSSSKSKSKVTHLCQSGGSSKSKQRPKQQAELQNLYKCPECPCLFAVDPAKLLGNTLPKCPCCENRALRGGSAGDDMYLMPEPELKEYKCNLCEFVTPEKSMFYAHLRTHPDDVYKCALCDYATTMKNLMTRHQRSHEVSRKYKCNQCEFVTMELAVLQVHLKTHNQTQELVLKCSECGYSCKCEEILRDHMWKHIDKIAPQGVVQLQKEGQSAEKTGPSNSETQALPAGSTASPQSLGHVSQTRPVQQTPSLFKCLLCGYVCEKLCTLKAHAWRHAGEEGCSYPVIEELFATINSQQNRIPNLPVVAVQPAMSTCCGQSSGKSCCQGGSTSGQCECQPVSVSHKQFPVIERLVSTAYARKYYPADGQSKPQEAGKAAVVPSKPESSEQLEAAKSQVDHQATKSSRMETEQEGPEEKETQIATRQVCMEMNSGNQTADTPKEQCGHDSESGTAKQNVQTTVNAANPLQINKDLLQKKAVSGKSMPSCCGDFSIIETRTSLQQLISDTVERQIGKDKLKTEAKGDASRKRNVKYAVEHPALQEAYQSEITNREMTKVKSSPTNSEESEVIVLDSGSESEEEGKAAMEESSEQREGTEKTCSTAASGVSCSHLLASLLQRSKQEGWSPGVQSVAEPATSKAQAGQGANALESLIAATLAGLKSQERHSGPEKQKGQPRSEEAKEPETSQEVPFVPPFAAKDLPQDRQKDCPNYKPNSSEPCVCDGGDDVIVDGQHDVIVVVGDLNEEKAQQGVKRPAGGDGMVTRSKRRKSGAVSPTLSEGSNESSSSKQGGISSSLLTVIERMRDNPNDSGEEIMEKLQQTSGGASATKKREVIDVESLIETVNVPQPLYQCKLCQYFSANKGYVKQHMRIHKERIPYKCPLCDVVGESSEDLQDHMMDHCKQRTYQCNMCPATFSNNGQLKAHVRGHDGNVPFHCETCDYESCNAATFRAHLKTHAISRVYTCYACSASFKQRYLLRQHKQVCEMNQTYSCQECEFTADSRANLEKHVRTHVKPFKCEICDYTSGTMSGVKNHMKFHASDKPYKCQHCDFAGPYPQSLRSHMKKHYGEAPSQQQMEQYKCNLCGYICSHLPSLKSHMWRHASEPNYNYDATNDVINAALDFDSKHTPPAAVKANKRKPVENENLSEPEGQAEPLVRKKQNKSKGFEYCLVAFRCSQCGYEGIDKAALTEHMKTHGATGQPQQPLESADRQQPMQQQQTQPQDPNQDQPLQEQQQLQPKKVQDDEANIAAATVSAVSSGDSRVLNTLETLADGVERCPEPDVIAHQEEVATEN